MKSKTVIISIDGLTIWLHVFFIADELSHLRIRGMKVLE